MLKKLFSSIVVRSLVADMYGISDFMTMTGGLKS